MRIVNWSCWRNRREYNKINPGAVITTRNINILLVNPFKCVNSGAYGIANFFPIFFTWPGFFLIVIYKKFQVIITIFRGYFPEKGNIAIRKNFKFNFKFGCCIIWNSTLFGTKISFIRIWITYCPCLSSCELPVKLWEITGFKIFKN